MKAMSLVLFACALSSLIGCSGDEKAKPAQDKAAATTSAAAPAQTGAPAAKPAEKKEGGW